MPKTPAAGDGCFVSGRRKIQVSGILDALIEYAEGRREMSSSQVSAALGLLKKALPDLSALALPGAAGEGGAAPDYAEIEIRIVDLQR